MSRAVRILSLGYDRNLMTTRSLLLRTAGYAVEEARSRHEALSQVRSDLIDLMLICHTVPEMEKRVVISAVRKQRFLIPILCVADGDYSSFSNSNDGYNVVPNSPEELLAAIDSAAKAPPPANETKISANSN